MLRCRKWCWVINGMLAIGLLVAISASCGTAAPSREQTNNHNSVTEMPSRNEEEEPTTSQNNGMNQDDGTNLNDVAEQADDEESSDPVLDQLNELSIAQKIGQMVIIGFEGQEMSAEVEGLITDWHVGGVILFSRNIYSVVQTRKLISDIQQVDTRHSIPLLVGIDEEGGRVSRMPSEVVRLPAARKIGDHGDPKLARALAEANGRILRTMGFNVNFAPVLDIDSNPDNPVIGDRSFGNTADQVSEIGLSVMRGLSEGGVIPVVKHFPGHGDTDVDSHSNLPVVTHEIDRFKQVEWAPFQDAVEAGAPAMMAGHLLMTALDEEQPVTLSSRAITGLLREQWGYEGVVISDDMTMGAITSNYAIGEAAVRAIEAGVDLLLVGHEQQLQIELLESLKQAYETGRLSEERLNESVYRILEMKNDFSPLPTAISDDEAMADIQQMNETISSLLQPMN